MNRKANLACNFNCLIKTEALFEVSRSPVHYKSGSITETVQDRERRCYYGVRIMIHNSYSIVTISVVTVSETDTET